MNNDSGTVAVKSNGKITSHFEGIYAKSTTGAISVESTGDVLSDFSSGIKTVGGTSSTVKVDAGSNVYGIYRGVMFSGGHQHAEQLRLDQEQYLYLCVSGSTGNETINNYNLITGSVNLDGGTNAFNNKSTGVFASGATVNLGGNTFTNAGNLTPGGLGVEQTTTLTGNFVQTSTGVFTVDIDHNLNDLLAVSGTISFDGKVMANVFALPSASGGAMIADATSVALAPTATAGGSTTTDFSLQVIAGNELWLTWVPVDIFDLFTDKVTPNQFSIGTYFNALRQSPDASAPLLALVNAVKALPNEADVLAALDRLQPEHYLAQVNDTWITSQFFVTAS